MISRSLSDCEQSNQFWGGTFDPGTPRESLGKAALTSSLSAMWSTRTCIVKVPVRSAQNIGGEEGREGCGDTWKQNEFLRCLRVAIPIRRPEASGRSRALTWHCATSRTSQRMPAAAVTSSVLFCPVRYAHQFAMASC